MKKLTFCLIGNDHLVVSCAKLLLANKHVIKFIFTEQTSVIDWCVNNDIPYYSLNAIITILNSFEDFDYLLSISNPLILKEEILSKPRFMAINYHNALLPSYGGTNATAWAILNDERVHGITWHKMTSRVDRGDILLQRELAIKDDDTAISLNIRCHQLAEETFPELLTLLENREFKPICSNNTASYYKSYDKPLSNGFVDWRMTAEDIYRHYRGLDFGVYANQIATLKFICKGHIFIIYDMIVENSGSNYQPGTLLSLKDGMSISTSTNSILIKNIRLLNGIEISIEELVNTLQLEEGESLVFSDEQLTEFISISKKYAINESFWVSQWKEFSHANVLTQTTRDGKIATNLNAVKNPCFDDVLEISDVVANLLNEYGNTKNIFSLLLVATIAIYLYKHKNYEKASFLLHRDVFADNNLNECTSENGIYSEYLPFNLSLNEADTITSVLAKIITLQNELSANGSYLIDINARYNDVSDQQTASIIRISCGDHSISLPQQAIYPVYQPLIHFILDKKQRNAKISTTIMLESEEDNYASIIKNHLINLLNDVTSNPEKNISTLSLVSPIELAQLVSWSNFDKTYAIQNNQIISIFQEQVKNHPKAIAIIDNNQSVTYEELEALSNQLANYLVQNNLITPSAGICTFLESGVWCIASLLAILKVGCYYIPLLKKSPDNLIQAAVSENDVKVILTDDKSINTRFKNLFAYSFGKPSIIQVKEINLERISSILKDPRFTEKAYVMYTSGSTGAPKGVLINQQGIIRLVKNSNYITITPKDGIAQASSIAFDAATFEIWGALLNGARLIITNKNTVIDPEKIQPFIVDKKITILFLTTRLFDRLAETNPNLFNSLNYLLVGGEAINIKWFNVVNQKLRNTSCRFIHVYGPTENTTFTTAYNIQKNRDYHHNIPIGSPIQGTQAIIVDKFNQILPVGFVGELLLGGIGLTPGYTGENTSVKNKFIDPMFISDKNVGRFYKSNDLVYWNSDGDLEYVARNDNIIKLRGYRVDLDSIQAYLLEHSSIDECVVVADKDDNNIKISAYIAVNSKAERSAVKENILNYLKEHFLEHMLPHHIYIVKSMPINANGKIDRKALITMFKFSTTIPLEHTIDDADPILYQMSLIWANVLKHSDFKVDDNYFDLGGDSLSIGSIILQIKNKYAVDISVSGFLNNPTIRGLGRLVKQHLDTSENCQVSFQSDELALMQSDMAFEVNILSSLKTSRQHEKKNIFLTGASGFLGCFFLKNILESTDHQIYCLSRNSKLQSSRDFLNYIYGDNYLSKTYHDRVEVILGNLNQPLLGMSSDLFNTLTTQIDEIYHVGAEVNHIYDYSSLRASNVNSTKEIIRLATESVAKPILYVSTLSAVSVRDSEVITEKLPESEEEIYTIADGYSQTKWVSEFILTRLARQGHTVKIVRPGWIMGLSVQNKPVDNHLIRLVKGCIEIGMAPDWDCDLRFLPVDFVANALLYISQTDEGEQVYNLTNLNSISWRKIVAWLNSIAYTIKLVPIKDWVKHYVSCVDQSNPLMPFISLYLDEKYKRLEYPDMTNKVVQNNITSLLHSNGITFPPLSVDQLKNCFPL